MILCVDKWEVLKRAKPRIIDAFAPAGIDRVHYAMAFSEPYEFNVWLGAATDVQRDALALEPDLAQRVGDLLLEMGIEMTDAEFEGVVVVQSQETVDRDYDGSWFYAMR